MRSGPREHFAGYMRNFIFGVEDSLVSTVGLLSGITVAGTARHDILVTGTVLIFVEAFSMAVGSFLSERSAEEYIEGMDASPRRSIKNGVIMFFSYFFSGFIPLLPYLFTTQWKALFISIALSLVALFVLGTVSAEALRTRILRGGLRMLFIGGVAVGMGVAVGLLIK